MSAKSRCRPEREIQKAIAEYLKVRGVLAFRMNTGGMFGEHKGKRWAVRFGTPGMADILAFPQGKPPLWIEVKSAEGTQSTFQRGFEMMVTRENHRYIVARSIEDVMKEL